MLHNQNGHKRRQIVTSLDDNRAIGSEVTRNKVSWITRFPRLTLFTWAQQLLTQSQHIPGNYITYVTKYL